MLVVAIPLDRPVAVWVHQSGTDVVLRNHRFTEIIKTPGTFWFAAAIAVLGILLRQIDVKQAIVIVLASIFSGSNAIVKWIVGRTRPFKLSGPDQPYPFHFQPFWHGITGLFNQKDLCFPSGHACTSFALATAVLLVMPQWWIAFATLAALVAAERVLENAHYMSDVIGGIGLGCAGSLLAFRMMRRWLNPTLRGFEPIAVISSTNKP
jgi:membrane-associated phospholipid phosphatase